MRRDRLCPIQLAVFHKKRVTKLTQQTNAVSVAEHPAAEIQNRADPPQISRWLTAR